MKFQDVADIYRDSTDCILKISRNETHDHKRKVISINRPDMTLNTRKRVKGKIVKRHKQQMSCEICGTRPAVWCETHMGQMVVYQWLCAKCQ